MLSNLAGVANLRSLSQGLYISSNTALPACWAERVATQTGTSCNCSANDGTGACP